MDVILKQSVWWVVHLSMLVVSKINRNMGNTATIKQSANRRVPFHIRCKANACSSCIVIAQQSSERIPVWYGLLYAPLAIALTLRGIYYLGLKGVPADFLHPLVSAKSTVPVNRPPHSLFWAGFDSPVCFCELLILWVRYRQKRGRKSWQYLM